MTDGVAELRTVADYQFGTGAGAALFPADAELSLTRTSSGRPRQIRLGDRRLATYGTDGRFRLSVAGARRLREALPDRSRVVVGSESEPYVREGRNAFAKFVRGVDDAIRPRDEALVERADGSLLAVGRAELSGAGMLAFETGMAVKVREGAQPESRA